MKKSKLQSFIAGMPKTELHIHLLGAIPPETLWALVEKYKKTAEVKSLSQLHEKYHFKDFLHFIETWIWQQQFINEPEDLEFISANVAEDMIKQNIRYAEVFYTCNSHLRKGMTLGGVTNAILNGFSKYKDQIELKLIHDFGRNRGPEEAIEILEKLNELRCSDLIGIGIGGPEEGYPPESFKEVYEKARHMGFKTNAHAGEAAGAASVWGAINTLKVDRIGHGTRSYEDPNLIDYLKEYQIPLEMNPISNCMTQVVKDIEKHPIRNYFDKGLFVTVNSDDPKMFHTSLENEYFVLVEQLGFTGNEIKQLLHNSIQAAWCDTSRKVELAAAVDNYFSTNIFPENTHKESDILDRSSIYKKVDIV